jgi:hypothetical protein
MQGFCEGDYAHLLKEARARDHLKGEEVRSSIPATREAQMVKSHEASKESRGKEPRDQKQLFDSTFPEGVCRIEYRLLLVLLEEIQ